MNITMQLCAEQKSKPTDESKLGFGRIFTDHMFVLNHTQNRGWHDARIVPYAPFALQPACSSLHYGQAIFEGLKAYSCANDSIQLFRARDNFVRMNQSAKRLCMPELNVDDCMEALEKLVELERLWVPKQEGTSLYIRPTMIANDETLGVHAAHSYIFFIILSPAGPYYAEGLKPVKIFVEDEYVRAVRGGVGFAKTAGNYAASILASNEAQKKGYAQVLWLDGRERRYIEEVGAMNIMFVMDGKLVTPALQGSILPGITRDSVLQLAREFGLGVEERPIAIEEIFKAQQEGRLQEVFGTGTAAVISAVSHLCWNGTEIQIADGQMGPVATRMYQTLTGIQYGRVPDTMGWTTTITAKH